MSVKTKTQHKLLHKNDIFGYQIPVNFNGRRIVHTTTIGGIFSIIIKIMYFIYILNSIWQMITYQNDEISERKFTNLHVNKSVKFNDMNI